PLCQHVHEGELDLEPVSKACLVAPDPRHLRPRVALDHRRSVLPNPPPPRVVDASDSSSVHSMRTTGATTSCAMRSPRRTTAMSSPRFTSSTCISPRYSLSIVPGAFNTVRPVRCARPLRGRTWPS